MKTNVDVSMKTNIDVSVGDQIFQMKATKIHGCSIRVTFGLTHGVVFWACVSFGSQMDRIWGKGLS